MGLPQWLQLPKEGESILVSAILRLESFLLAVRRPASATPRLLMASIRLTRPIALSGEIGLAFSSLRTISASVSAMVSMILAFRAALSSAVIGFFFWIKKAWKGCTSHAFYFMVEGNGTPFNIYQINEINR